MAAPTRSKRDAFGSRDVRLDARGRVDLPAVAWSGPSWQWLEANGYDIESLILRGQRKAKHGAWVNWNL